MSTLQKINMKGSGTGYSFMKKPFSDPFAAVDSILKKYRLGQAIDASIIDFHAEATSEKMALAHWLDGRASLVVGTHTHVPTADLQILQKGTAFQTDAGMCGDFNSVIGMDPVEPISRFVTGMSRSRFEPARGVATICGVVVDVNSNGLAKQAYPVRQGGHLVQSCPIEQIRK